MEDDGYYQEKLEAFVRDEAYDDAMASNYFQEQIAETKAEGIIEFQQERLREYYLDNKNLPQLVDRHLYKAKELIDANFAEAGFVFSFIAVEIILKNIFLKPFLHGSFIYQDIADLVVEKMLEKKDDSFKKTLFRVLKHSTDFDFVAYKRSRVKIALWEEITNLRKQRNKIIHENENVDLDKAKYVYRIATHLNQMIFPKLLDNVGLKILERKITLK